MTSRRAFLLGAGALTALAAPMRVGARTTGERWVNDAGETGLWEVPEDLQTRLVSVPEDVPAGQIHVIAGMNALLWTLGDGRAIRYAVALGRAGRQFDGRAYVGRKEEWPSWRPTTNMIRREPDYARYAGGVSGGLHNPLGARALYLYRGGRDTLYRIHGTSQPWTIGRDVSSGCIRLFNSGIVDLYRRVPIGTVVAAY